MLRLKKREKFNLQSQFLRIKGNYLETYFFAYTRIDWLYLKDLLIECVNLLKQLEGDIYGGLFAS